MAGSLAEEEMTPEEMQTLCSEYTKTYDGQISPMSANQRPGMSAPTGDDSSHTSASFHLQYMMSQVESGLR